MRLKQEVRDENQTASVFSQKMRRECSGDKNECGESAVEKIFCFCFVGGRGVAAVERAALQL